jgi:hypothetical protein
MKFGIGLLVFYILIDSLMVGVIIYSQGNLPTGSWICFSIAFALSIWGIVWSISKITNKENKDVIKN